jgi:hypothetical protein
MRRRHSRLMQRCAADLISSETIWYVSNGISNPFFATLLALFAHEAEAGRERIVVLGHYGAAAGTANRTRMGSGSFTCPA